MKKLFLILVIAIMAVMMFAGCGSDGTSEVEGKYVLEAGGSTIAVLTLEADGKAKYSLSSDSEGLSVTYKVEGDKLVLIGADGKEIETAKFEIEDKGLRDSTNNLWKKQ